MESAYSDLPAFEKVLNGVINDSKSASEDVLAFVDKINFNIGDYEDYAMLSVLTLLAYLTVLLHISTLFWNTLVVTLPMAVTVFALWAVINYAVFYKLGCKNGNKEIYTA